MVVCRTKTYEAVLLRLTKNTEARLFVIYSLAPKMFLTGYIV